MEELQDELWGGGGQHDAQEFLHALLDQLQVCCWQEPWNLGSICAGKQLSIRTASFPPCS